MENHSNLYRFREKEGAFMNISIPLENGILPDAYGKYSPEEYRRDDCATESFPIEVQDVPAGTQSLALAFTDYDSIPVCGFQWIHWIACGISPEVDVIPEGASRSDFPFVEGLNSCISRAEGISEEVLTGYIGPCPPDKDHRYTLRVYALDTELSLRPGFYMNDLHWAMQGHIIDSAEVNVVSRS